MLHASMMQVASASSYIKSCFTLSETFPLKLAHMTLALTLESTPAQE